MIDPLENIDISETLETVQPLESASPVLQWYEKFLCNNQADYIVAVECSLYNESVSTRKEKRLYEHLLKCMQTSSFLEHGEI